jgi:Rps23 Pro-64 3,4-dihydroxylase Tpa1-like proline 4-hydroxylase
MNFIVKSQENFQTNLSTYFINTMNKHNFQRTNANLFCFAKSTFYASIRILSSLPCGLIILNNQKTEFEIAWSQYLNTRTFHSVINFCYV